MDTTTVLTCLSWTVHNDKCFQCLHHWQHWWQRHTLFRWDRPIRQSFPGNGAHCPANGHVIDCVKCAIISGRDCPTLAQLNQLHPSFVVPYQAHNWVLNGWRMCSLRIGEMNHVVISYLRVPTAYHRSDIWFCSVRTIKITDFFLDV